MSTNASSDNEKAVGNTLERCVEYIWYKNKFLGYILLPLAVIFYILTVLRKWKLTTSSSVSLSAPVVVVGNISVGGTGKTPAVIAIVEHLQSKGFNPGVISRGYGGSANYPYQLQKQTLATQSGDEPLLIFRRCDCPVVVAPDRLKAAKYLLENNEIDIIISDDGLQHYALPRQLEIAVIDGQRGLGNGLCLPAGPLREVSGRLKTVDYVLVNGESTGKFDARQTKMLLEAQALMPLPATGKVATPEVNITVNAVAAIGNPDRFFSVLEQQGFDVLKHPFPDHHQYLESELVFDNKHPTLMTEKDAVKCGQFTSLDKHWYLPVTAVFPEVFWQDFDNKIDNLMKEN